MDYSPIADMLAREDPHASWRPTTVTTIITGVMTIITGVIADILTQEYTHKTSWHLHAGTAIMRQ